MNYRARRWIVFRVDSTLQKKVYLTRLKPGGDYCWNTRRERAKEYWNQERAENVAMRVVMRYPEWTGAVGALQNIRPLETR